MEVMMFTRTRFLKLLTLILIAVSSTVIALGFAPLSHEVYSRSNGDVYLKAVPKVVILAYEINIPLVLEPDSEDLLLVRQEDGSYILDYDPSQLALGVGWGESNHNLYYFDFNRDGLGDLFLQAKTSANDSVVLEGGNKELGPILVQNINAESLGVDISAETGVKLTLTDSQLYVSVLGEVDKVSYVGLNGIFGVAEDVITVMPSPNYSNPEDYSVQPVSSVGVIDESIDITSNGSFAYKAPISVPPGINGLVPNLSINYNSRQGNGLLGKGGFLSGISVISRCPLIFAVDDEARGLTYTDNDALCLNGQRLIKVNDQRHFTDGAEYRTEIDSFTKVILNRSGENISFDVFYKNSLIHEHTKQINVIHDFKTVGEYWPVSKVEDRFGNYIIYKYLVFANGQFAPDVIEYANAEVQFEYNNGQRADSVLKYQSVSIKAQDKYLVKITTLTNRSDILRPVKEYNFLYFDDDNPRYSDVTGFLRLKGLQECGYDISGYDVSCKAPTRFVWQDLNHGYLTGEAEATNPVRTQTLTIDWNFDGFQDLLVIGSENIYVQYAFENGSLSEKNSIYNFSGQDLYSAVVVDIDSNGTEDLLFRLVDRFSTTTTVSDGTVSSYSSNQQWAVLLNQQSREISVSDSFVVDGPVISTNNRNVITDYEPGDLGWDSGSSPLPVVLDAKGNGKPDIILPVGSSWILKENSSNYDGISFSNDHTLPFTVDASSAISLIGRGADGYMQLFAHFRPYFKRFSIAPDFEVGSLLQTGINSEKAILLDINNDGLQDVVNENEDVLRIYFFSGIDFKLVQTDINSVDVFPHYEGSLSYKNYPTKVIDYNNDGLQDLIFESDGKLHCLPSNGRGFGPRFDTDVGFYAVENGNPYYFIDGGRGSEGCRAFVEAFESNISYYRQIINDLVFRPGAPFYIDPSWVVTAPNGHPSGVNIPDGEVDRFRASLTENDLIDEAYQIEQALGGIISNGNSLLQWAENCSSCNVSNVESIEASIETLGYLKQSVSELLLNPDFGPSTYILAFDATIADYFVIQLTCSDIDFDDVYVARVLGQGAQDYQLADFNGDGWVDIAHLTSSTSNRIVVEQNVNRSPDAIRSIINGQGIVYSNIYKPITDDEVYSLKSSFIYSFPTLPLQSSLNVVRHLDIYDSRLDTKKNSFTYKYENALVDLHGRGFLGFNKRITYDADRSISIEHEKHQLFPFTGRDEKIVTESEKLDVGKIAHSDFEWGYINTNGNNNVFFPYLEMQVDYNYSYESSGWLSKLIKKFEYDDYGNTVFVTDMSQQVGNNVISKVTTDNIIDINGSNNDVGDWLIGFIDSSVVKSFNYNNGFDKDKRDSSDKVVSINNASRQGTLKLSKSERFEVGHPSYLKEEYSFDLYGNLQDKTTSGSLISGRTESILDYIDSIYPKYLTNNQFGADERVLEYDLRFGTITKETGYDGLSISRAYDEFGRVTETVLPSGITETITYQFCIDINECTLPDGTVAVYKIETTSPVIPTTTRYFDAFDRQVMVDRTGLIASQVIRQLTLYNNLGLVKYKSLPFDAISNNTDIKYIEYIYDHKDRVVQEIRPDGGEISTVYSYDGSGNSVVTTTETIATPDGTTKTQVSESTFNAIGQLIQKTNAVGTANQVSVSYDYDAHGNMDWVKVNDSALELTTSTFDLVGNKIELNDPDVGTLVYSYDSLGNLLSTIDNKGQTVTYTYDKLNRQISRTEDYLPSLSKTTYWFYDKDERCALADSLASFNYNGKLCRVEQGDNEFVESYGYDSNGNLNATQTDILTDQIDSDGQPVFKSYLVEQTYDAHSRLKRVKYPSNLSVEYAYRNKYLSKVFKQGHKSIPYWEAKEIDAFGNVVNFELGNGVTSSYNYSLESGRLDSILSVDANLLNIQDLNYGWESNGNMAFRSWSYSYDNERTEIFTYDALNRLRSSQGLPENAKSYTYHLNGNIKTVTGISGEYSYGNGTTAGPHAVISAGGISYQYDKNGNMTKRGGKTIKYTSFNKPYEIQSNGDTSYFKYGPDRLRYYQKTGDKTTYYINGGSFEEILEGNKTTFKTYVGDFLIHESEQGQETLSYIHRDALGSVEAITDSDGNLLQRMSFNPFGSRREGDASFTVRGFTDHEHLDESGLIHMNGRVYDPQIGRFLSADPLIQAPENSQSYNRYSYVWNNPLSMVDPSGYEAIDFKVGADGQLAYTLGGDNPFSYFPKSVERLMPVVRDIVISVAGLQNRKALIHNLGTSLNTNDRLDFKVLWNSYEREYHSPEERALYNTDMPSYIASSTNQSFFISNGDQRSIYERFTNVGHLEVAGVGVSTFEKLSGTTMQLGNTFNAVNLMNSYENLDANRGADALVEAIGATVGTAVGVYAKYPGADLAAQKSTEVIFTYTPDVNSRAIQESMNQLNDHDLSNIIIGLDF
jgi:RHS repeat-associated protein